MIGTKKTLLALILTVFTCVAAAQTSTNSPYTRYGFGNLADPGSANSKAMGGIAYALRDPLQVNFANPASYTAVDSLTFIFDGGLSLQKVNFSNGKIKQNANNASFDYITMQFRVANWAGVSIGLIPFSNVGYSLGRVNDAQEGYEDNVSANQYSGEGGMHQLYLGAGFKIFKNLSVGANISYLWGDIERTKYSSFPNNTAIMPTTVATSASMKSYKLDLGAQYTQNFGKKHQATVGVVFSPGHDITPELTATAQKGNSTTGYTVTNIDTTGICSIPLSVGAGITYTFDKKLTVGADALFQKWSDSKYLGDEFCDRYKLSAGAEYVPNPVGRNYLARVKYRIGGYYSKPYYKIEGQRAATEYGLTAGFGLPIPHTRSVVSVALQYANMEGSRANFLTENTFRICVGLTFNERWFFKRKVQ